MQAQAGRREFDTLYPRYDVLPVTAARLSAAFPFVGPAARISGDVKPAYHFVDGGYYDNFGILSAVDFLLEATANGTPPIKRILLIEIAGYDATSGRGPGAAPRGWFYQAKAPVQGLLQMRTSAQVSRNQTDTRMLAELMKGRGVELQRATFSFPAAGEPLSWHLTPAEQAAIVAAWPQRSQEAAKVKKFLE